MAIDPVKIPQNVYIEDRIVGPLTLRQLIIIAVGGGFSYAVYSVISKQIGHPPDLLTTILVWIPAVIAAAFALIKINDLSLLRICLLFIEQSNKPAKRTYAPRRGISITFHSNASKKDKEEHQEKTVKEQEKAQDKIRRLSAIMDTDIHPATEEAHTTPVDDAEEKSVAVRQVNDEPKREETPPFADDNDDTEPLYHPPVDKSRITADKTGHEEPFRLTDMKTSVFRDLLPPTA